MNEHLCVHSDSISDESRIGIVELAVCFLYERWGLTHSHAGKREPPVESSTMTPLCTTDCCISEGKQQAPSGHNYGLQSHSLKKQESRLCCHDTEHLVTFIVYSMHLRVFYVVKKPCFVIWGLALFGFMVSQFRTARTDSWPFFSASASSCNSPQGFDVRSSGASLLLPSLLTSSTGTQRRRQRLRRSVGWHSSSTRSSFKTSEKQQVCHSSVLLHHCRGFLGLTIHKLVLGSSGCQGRFLVKWWVNRTRNLSLDHSSEFVSSSN